CGSPFRLPRRKKQPPRVPVPFSRLSLDPGSTWRGLPPCEALSEGVVPGFFALREARARSRAAVLPPRRIPPPLDPDRNPGWTNPKRANRGKTEPVTIALCLAWRVNYYERIGDFKTSKSPSDKSA